MAPLPTNLESTDVCPELQAELEKSIQIALSNVRDPEVMRKAADRMYRLSEQIRQREGVLDVIMPILREIRDGE